MDLNGYTPFLNYCENKAVSKKGIKFLMENKAEVNTLFKGFCGYYLSFLNSSCDIETLKYLLENKANLNFLNSRNESILHFVSQNSFFSVNHCLLLLFYRADPSLLDINGNNPKMIAKTNQREDIFQVLKFYEKKRFLSVYFLKNLFLNFLLLEIFGRRKEVFFLEIISTNNYSLF